MTLQAPAARPPAAWRDAALGLALALATLAAYAQVFGFGFIGFDDPQYVAGNAQVQDGLSAQGVAWAFRTALMGSWHPLTWLSHMLDVELFGLDARGHHATSLLLHAANTVLLFAVLRSATGSRWRSALVAALFGLHPLHVESVAWVAERKDVLSTFTGLLALAAWLGYVRRPSPARYAGVAVLYAASLMSKPMLVTLPLALLLLDYWPLRRPLGVRTALEKAPLFALTLGASALALLTQRGANTALGEQQLSLAVRMANALLATTAYLGQIAFPVNLGMYYPHPYILQLGGVPPPTWHVAAAAALLAAATIGALAARRRRYLATGWLWYLLTLAPVIGIVQIGFQGRADRYTYVPSIGVFLAVVWWAADGVEALRARVPGVRPAAAAVALAALAACGALTWRQSAYWRDSLSLYAHTLAVTGRNPLIRFNYAGELRRAGRGEEAIAEYRRALEAAPNDPKIHLNLANALRDAGDTAGAMHHYREALAQRPDFALAHSNLGALLRDQGELEEAEHHYREALRLTPSRLTAYNLANLMRERGELDAAIDLYRRLLDTPEAPIHNNLALALQARGDLTEALHHYEEALALDPQHARAHNNAASVLLELGEPERAIEHLRRALEIEPDYPNALVQLGIALEERGEPDEALGYYRRALELDPAHETARARLEALRSRRSGSDAARPGTRSP